MRTVMMVRSEHGTMVESSLPQMNCGGTPLFDHDSGCAYRCDTCLAIIGSMGQSQRCKDMNAQEE